MILRRPRTTADLYPIDAVRAVDGDTLNAVIRLPFDVALLKNIRLRSWWADEPRGRWAEAGLAARDVLQKWCTGKALWIAAPSARLDRYGRVLAHLVWEERIIEAKIVLGHLALTESEHKRRRAEPQHAGPNHHQQGIACALCASKLVQRGTTCPQCGAE